MLCRTNGKFLLSRSRRADRLHNSCRWKKCWALDQPSPLVRLRSSFALSGQSQLWTGLFLKPAPFLNFAKRAPCALLPPKRHANDPKQTCGELRTFCQVVENRRSDLRKCAARSFVPQSNRRSIRRDALPTRDRPKALRRR